MILWKPQPWSKALIEKYKDGIMWRGTKLRETLWLNNLTCMNSTIPGQEENNISWCSNVPTYYTVGPGLAYCDLHVGTCKEPIVSEWTLISYIQFLHDYLPHLLIPSPDGDRGYTP